MSCTELAELDYYFHISMRWFFLTFLSLANGMVHGELNFATHIYFPQFLEMYQCVRLSYDMKL